MIIFRILGWILLFFGIVLFTADVFHGITATTGFEPVTIAKIWDFLSSTSSADFLGYIKVNFGDRIWAFLQFIFNSWAFLFLLFPGGVLEATLSAKGDASHRRARKATRENAIEAKKATERLKRQA
jgi:hypothetical protein